MYLYQIYSNTLQIVIMSYGSVLMDSETSLISIEIRIV